MQKFNRGEWFWLSQLGVGDDYAGAADGAISRLVAAVMDIAVVILPWPGAVDAGRHSDEERLALVCLDHSAGGVEVGDGCVAIHVERDVGRRGRS